MASPRASLDTAQEPRDWHYLSAIPLAPGAPRRTSFSPPTTLHAAPPPLSPHDRPDVPSTPQLEPSPVISSGGATFDVARPRPPQRTRTGSPPRPRRPSHPEQAVMFNAPAAIVLGGAGASEDQYALRPGPPSSETSPQMSDFPVPPSHASPSSGLLPPIPMTRSTSSRRKPVPSYFGPGAAVASPAELSRVDSPTSGDPSRLSVGGFEALVARRANEGRAVEGDEEGRVVWSPRADLGLDREGVEAREMRRRWDEQRLVSAPAPSADVHRAPQFLHPSPGRLAPFPPAEHVHVSPRGTRARVRQTTVEDLSSEPPSPQAANTATPRAQSVWSSRHRRYVSTEDGADAYVRAQRAGPQLRRGSKRLSEVPSVRALANDGEDEHGGGGEVARVVSVGSPTAPTSQRRPSTGAVGRLFPQPSVTSTKSVLRRGDARFGSAARNSRARSEGGAPRERFEVVVLDPREKESPDVAGDGDWERLRTETLCRPERMDWSMCDFAGRFPRLLFLLYPIAVFAHVPVTLFLDFVLLYVLCQLARYPSVPSPTSRNIAARALVGVPDIEPSTGWWVAVGVYGACTAAWFFGVLVWKELGRDYYSRWKSGDRSVEIEKVYAGAASFKLACLRSYSHFSFFWRVRLAPFGRSGTIAQAVEGTTLTDGVQETASRYRQNWPTVLLLLPRAGITVAVLLLFSTTAYGTSTSTTARDSAFFDADGTLSRFSAGVLLANAAWVAWRLVLVLVAAVVAGMPRLSALFARRRPLETYPALGQSAQRRTSSAPSLSSRRPSVMYSTWRTRRQRRIRTAILACLGVTPLQDDAASAGLSPVLAKSPYVTGYGLEKAREAYSTGQFATDATVLRVEHDSPARRGSAPIFLRSDAPQHQDSSELSYRRARAPTSPKLDGEPPSPLIQFSPATPSPPRWVAPARDVAHTSSIEPRRASVAAGADDFSASGDVGQSILHRRMRSLQHEPSEGLIVFPTAGIDLSPRSLPPRATGGSLSTLPYASVGETAPRSLLPNILASPRPPLVSRFSAFSSPYASTTAASTPRDERDSPAHLDSTSSSAPSMTPSPSDQLGSGWDPARTTNLRAQLAAGQAERTLASQRLFDEVQRARAEEDAHDAQARDDLDLRPPSELLASADGHASFVTAREPPRSVDDGRWSHVSSSGEHSGTQSDGSTVRGPAAERSPVVTPTAFAGAVPVVQLGTPPAERDEDDSVGESTPERADGQAQTLVPLGLSRASGSASFDLSAYNSPDLTGGEDSGQFDRASPAMWRSDSL
ncbi:uncharacterized protein RHOBADRAFT_50421 [Rhodotorula graminis WP1]|uniref:Proteophosphoglycan ppg4 n=1 Tax=Rhodotorula graminis (strain WP1) TaxID=578459 RepID=A0A0P9EPS4_RHOGW|nr:uncharacterized protein RHOBADRAFT_50421 [Rhodotorula graminis WP1]KPV71534.1 hypothetical protein RHOBADRAFT_50421 [Rhodotorula graminis WP1]